MESRTAMGVAAGRPRRWVALARRIEFRVLATALATAAALWAFLALAGEVREGETTGFDRQVLLWFRMPGDLEEPIGPRWLRETARDVTALGGYTVLTLVVVAAVVLLLMHGRRLQALIFAGVVIAAQGLIEALKAALGRARPDLVPHHDLVYSASFPSGHSAMTPVVYLTLAAILAAGEPRRAVRGFLLAVAVFLVIVVGISRVYLGVHWPTDVLAGWTLGAGIAIAASLALHRAAPRRPASGEVAPDAPGVD
jgi:undecaprenyl-diphosphatase